MTSGITMLEEYEETIAGLRATIDELEEVVAKVTHEKHDLQDALVEARQRVIRGRSMSERMTVETLAAIESRAAKAFCAPWTYTEFAVECRCEHDDCEGVRDNIRIESPHEYPDGQVVADVPGLEGFAAANGEFIAHARADVPALVAEVRALAADNERLREALRQMCRLFVVRVEGVSFAPREIGQSRKAIEAADLALGSNP